MLFLVLGTEQKYILSEDLLLSVKLCIRDLTLHRIVFNFQNTVCGGCYFLHIIH